jgi:hypothetical protein
MKRFSDKERTAGLARRQQGRITRAQLAQLGIADGTIQSWTGAGYLIRVHPKVYAVGHMAPSRDGELWAALLYGGPGAMLSHATAAHWRGLIDHPPRVIQISTPRKVASLPKVRIYGRRVVDRASWRDLPVTSIPQTMLDLAATADLQLVRRALARLDYMKLLNVQALEALCGHGKRGSTELRTALDVHQPRLAHTNGKLEENFLAWCEHWRLPLPLLNVYVHGFEVDAYWPDHALVVELDGYDNHSSRAQLRRDRAKDLKLRGHGLTVLRYDWALVHQQPDAVHAELVAQLRAR